MSSEVERKAVLITGTSSGIGQATATHLDSLGYRVFAAVRKDEDADNLRRLASSRLTPVILDVTNVTSIEAAREQVEAGLAGGDLWGLINNAGIGVGGPMEFLPLERIRATFEVNYFGMIQTTRAFLPLIRKARGRVVNVSSTATLFTLPFHGSYSSAKLAVNGFSDALRLELRSQGVQVSAVICGCVRTPIWEKGRQMREEVRHEMPKEALEIYGEASSRIGEFFREIGSKGISPEAAAKVISRAITDGRAKPRYLVGRDAYVNTVLSLLVHGRLRDLMLLRVVGLTSR